MRIVLANSKPSHLGVEQKCKELFNSINLNKKSELTYEQLNDIKPDYVFFIHWSYIIPKKIHENFNCIVFHMTDLPYGRGGSPLQNLISRGHTQTVISAIKVEEGIDTGPIFMKKPLSLNGTAEEIFLRSGKILISMIEEIIVNNPKPVEQTGQVEIFKRRNPDESDIRDLADIETVYNFIRMLDADRYPKAFIETEFFRFEFSRASIKVDGIIADVKIINKS